MNLWGFISAAVLLTLMPGPDILFVITQSITRGRPGWSLPPDCVPA